MKIVDPKYSVLYLKGKRSWHFHEALEVLELGTFVDLNGSYNEEKDPERKWKVRSKVVKGGIQAGLLDFLERSEGHISVYPLLYTIRHWMYIPSKRITEDRIESITHMILDVESSKSIGEENLMEDCLTQMKFEKSLNTDIKVNI